MRKLDQSEIAKLKKEHLRVLNEIDRQVDARKDTMASYLAIIKEYRGKETEIRHMLETGYAVPEQMPLIPLDDRTDDTTITITGEDGHSVTTTPEELEKVADDLNAANSKKSM